MVGSLFGDGDVGVGTPSLLSSLMGHARIKWGVDSTDDSQT